MAATPSPRVRPAACAGRFYPAATAALRREVSEMIAAAKAPDGPAPKAIIAPHAGYIYSGPVAASVYLYWRSVRDQVKRVILVGPSHYAEFPGLAASSADAFETPLAPAPVDQRAVAALRSLPQVITFDRAHEPEHCLEVQLPFLQSLLTDFTIVPLLTGDTSDEDISEVLETLWGGPETRIVISSDLSHYHDYPAARKLDAATARAIEALQPAGIDGNHACGCLAVCGLLHAARRRGLRAATVDLRNSGDTAGARDRVVGYGAFAFFEDEISSN